MNQFDMQPDELEDGFSGFDTEVSEDSDSLLDELSRDDEFGEFDGFDNIEPYDDDLDLDDFTLDENFDTEEEISDEEEFVGFDFLDTNDDEACEVIDPDDMIEF